MKFLNTYSINVSSSMSTEILMPPDPEFIKLKNFDLSLIEKTFGVSSYQRTLIPMKVKTICRAITQNKFSDNIIRVTTATETTYEILDGQHRIKALEFAQKNHGLTHYDLILCVLKNENAKYFREINVGKPLTLNDHLRAINYITHHDFFTTFQNYCDYSRKDLKSTYSDFLNCLYCVKESKISSIKMMDLEEFMEKITQYDLKILKKFIETIYQIIPELDSHVYQSYVFRNLFCICYINKYSKDEMNKIITAVKGSHKIDDFLKKKKINSFNLINSYMTEILAPKIGLRAKTGLVYT